MRAWIRAPAEIPIYTHVSEENQADLSTLSPRPFSPPPDFIPADRISSTDAAAAINYASLELFALTNGVSVPKFENCDNWRETKIRFVNVLFVLFAKEELLRPSKTHTHAHRNRIRVLFKSLARERKSDRRKRRG